MDLTITVDEDTLKRARARASQENTSVDALIQGYLVEYAQADRHPAEACDRLLALSQSCQSRRGNAKWTREDLYER